MTRAEVARRVKAVLAKEFRLPPGPSIRESEYIDELCENARERGMTDKDWIDLDRAIEEEFDVNIPEDRLFEWMSVRDYITGILALKPSDEYVSANWKPRGGKPWRCRNW